jgi:hypothetical protein
MTMTGMLAFGTFSFVRVRFARSLTRRLRGSARKITELLHAQRFYSIDDMQRIQLDQHSGNFDDILPLINGILDTNLLAGSV